MFLRVQHPIEIGNKITYNFNKFLADDTGEIVYFADTEVPIIELEPKIREYLGLDPPSRPDHYYHIEN